MMSEANSTGSTPSGVRADFISRSGRSSLDDTEQQAQYDIRREFQISTGCATPIGQVLYTLDLDITVDDNVSSVALGYEYFTLKDLNLYCQSTSPAGTSSGGIQICHVTDPDNVQFQASNYADTSTGEFNVHKCVRQEGSLLVRPRESVDLTLDICGWLYTYKPKSMKTRRFSSFGSVVMILRDPPATGDTLSFTITFTGKAVFARTTISPASIPSAPSVFMQQELDLKLLRKEEKVSLYLTDNAHVTLRMARPTINDVLYEETLFFVNGVCDVDQADFLKWVGDGEKDIKPKVLEALLKGINKINGDITFLS